MRKMTAKVTLAVLFALGSMHATDATARAKRPDLKRCPDLAALPDGQIGRSRPVVVPKDMDRLLRVTRDRLAIATLGGATLCVDMRLKGEVENMQLSPDGRFFSFDWAGYEADGHVVVDRTGPGQQIDTGAKPVFSPSGNRFASVHQSESAFSDLEGLGVWQVSANGMQQIANVTSIPEMEDWKVDSWGGEECLNLSAIPFSRMPDNRSDLSNVERDRFVARPIGRTWSVIKVPAKGC